MPFSEFKRAHFFRKRILFDHDVFADKISFGEFAFTVDDEGRLRLTGDREDVVEEAIALVRTPEARGLLGFIGYQ